MCVWGAAGKVCPPESREKDMMPVSRVGTSSRVSGFL